MRYVVAFAGLFALTGCEGALRQMASGFVGCSPDEIEVSNDNVGFNTRSFDATCHGHLFHCSGGAKTSTSCKEDISYAEKPDIVKVPLTASVQSSEPEAVHAVSTSDRAWVRYLLRDCGLSVLLPGVPQEHGSLVGSGAVATTVHSAYVDNPNWSAGFSCSQIPGKGTILARRTLSGARDTFLQKTGATLESEREVRTGDMAGRDLRVSIANEKALVRIAVVGRQIVILTLEPVAAYTVPEIQNYFSSLEVKPAEPSGGAHVLEQALR